MQNQLVDTSKFLSYVLRHHPESVGIKLDSEGWADMSALIAAAGRMRRRLDRALIEEVVRTSDKKRFAISEDGLRIRAVQGHSTSSVQLSHQALVPPPLLFHGTAAHHLDAILEQGLVAGERHHVHLSADYPTAVAVGKRHGKPVVLRVDAGVMHAAGCVFYQAENGVWLTDRVPPRFLARTDAG